MADTDEDDFGALFEASVAAGSGQADRRLRPGEVVEGVVVAIGDDTVFVDVGTRAEGRIARHELQDKTGKLQVALGDKLRATVRSGGGRTAPELSVSMGGRLDTTALEIAAQSGTPVEGTFSNAVKAGLEVDVGGVRAFCPASQVELGYAADLEAYVGQTHFFRVLDVRDSGRSVVVSRKALLLAEREQRAAAAMERIEAGAELEGIVQSLQPYGAFVDLGGIQGLVHISEVSHMRIGSPGDVISVGESVAVKVLSVDQGKSGKPDDVRISLSMKALKQPEAGSTPSPSDEVITAKVAKVESFGVLVDTAVGRGLVPIAELSLPPGSDPRRSLGEGDDMDVVLVHRDTGSGKLRFSAKRVEEVQAKRAFAAFKKGDSGGSLGSLGDLLRAKLPGGSKKG